MPSDYEPKVWAKGDLFQPGDASAMSQQIDEEEQINVSQQVEIDAAQADIAALEAADAAQDSAIGGKQAADPDLTALAGMADPAGKLAGIESGADVTDAGNVGAAIHGASAKVTPVSADELALVDSGASNVLARVTFANLLLAIRADLAVSAPATLDTFDELAAALGDDPNFAATITGLIGAKQPKFMTGTCSTAAGTAAKTVTLDAPWASYTPVAGDRLRITFTNGNSTTSLTLSVNSGAAKAIQTPSGGTIAAHVAIATGGAVDLIYNGTVFELPGPTQNSTYAEIAETDIVNAASSTQSLITGRRAEYLMANEATKDRTLTGKTLTSPKLTSGTAPATATSTGAAGQIEYDANYIYIAVAANTWKRATLSSW